MKNSEHQIVSIFKVAKAVKPVKELAVNMVWKCLPFIR